jgi:ATP-dependent RNA helicase DDX42
LKIIDPLPPIDHSQINYENFEKNFYEEHEDIKNLENAEIDSLRETLGKYGAYPTYVRGLKNFVFGLKGIKVSGLSPPKPVCSFGHFGFDEQLIRAIRKSGFTQPTPIQAQVRS